MKKFLLLSLCMFLCAGAKAAEYEITTALSSPYGMFSTFSVFGDATVGDLIIGAVSKNDITPTGHSLPIYRPIQETYLQANDISFGGNLNIERDLFLSAPNQTYSNIVATLFSSSTVPQSTFFDLNFSNITIPTLYASNLITGPLTINGPIQITTLRTAMLRVYNSTTGRSFTFPSVRGTSFGNLILQSTPSNKCGTDSKGHYYGPWVTCASGSCPSVSNNCDNDNTAEFTCSDSLTSSKNCIDIRQVRYRVTNVDTKPYISDVKSFYRKCVYGLDAEGEALKCNMQTYADGEDAYNSIPICSSSDKDSCISLCGNQGGCSGTARSCRYVTDTQFGADCAFSGWEMGSGLECKDSYKRVMYTIYTCPAGSDYTVRPANSTFSQYREVACMGDNVENTNTSNTYCGKEFLVVDFETVD